MHPRPLLLWSVYLIRCAVHAGDRERADAPGVRPGHGGHHLNAHMLE
jgi:hypothetical protein